MKRTGSGRWHLRRTILGFFCLWLAVGVWGPVFAFEKADPLTDREIAERLARLEESVKNLTEAVNRGFQAVEMRFQGVDQRFQAVEIRFQGMEQSFNQRFDQIVQLMTGIVATFGGIVMVAIGFALWDRRTMIRPFETKTRAIEEELAKNKDKLHRLLEALRELAKQDGKIAEVLRSFALL
ncbi:hypothetical protein [Desulfatirhabdium butyrativorans]|uniref:hypothetical protein n=1 Tax=Desulfatirhabdium butyrativorans TaxID=340467 RepID=UPI00041FE399|nr:hypothetical protein [Desulfatirhabdium butyrativorans]